MVWRKYEEISAPCVEEFCFITDYTYKKEEVYADACLEPFLFISYQQEVRALIGKITKIPNYHITMNLQWINFLYRFLNKSSSNLTNFYMPK